MGQAIRLQSRKETTPAKRRTRADGSWCKRKSPRGPADFAFAIKLSHYTGGIIGLKLVGIFILLLTVILACIMAFAGWAGANGMSF